MEISTDSEMDNFLETTNSESKWSWDGSQKERMKRMFETGFKSDLTILVGLKKVSFSVHRVILEAQSEKLNKIIEQLTPGTDLEIIDYDPAIFGMFLRHLYIGDSGAGIEAALPLHKIASDYQVGDLVTQCSDLLKGDLNDHNVTIIYQQAMELAQKELIQTSLDYICRNGWKILERNEFLELRLECFYEILKRDDLMARDELQVVKAVIRWTEAQCELQNLPLEPNSVANENMRKVMNKLLWLLRLPVMDRAEFNINPEAKRIKGMLTNEENLSLLYFFNVPENDRAKMGTDVFNPVPRTYYDGGKVYELDRFLQPLPLESERIVQTPVKKEKLELTIDRDIMFKGLKFRPQTFKVSGEDQCDWGQFEATVLVKNVECRTTLLEERKTGEFISTGRMEFKRPVKLESGQWHSIELNFGGAVYVFKAESSLYDRCDETKYQLRVGTDYRGDQKLSLINEDDETEVLNFHFRRSEGSEVGGLTVEQGLIAGFMFQLY